MKYWTYDEVKDKVRRDLGLEQEEFVTNPEFMGYVNSGIDEAEAEILKLCEDYLLPEPMEIDMVAGQKAYDLPEDIYANKIRSMIYKNGTEVYPIKQFKTRAHHFSQVLELETHGPQAKNYRYVIYNNGGASKPRFHIYPTPKENVPGGIILFYIRNANRIENGDDLIDIPEFVSFIIQYCKVRCYEKEGHPNLPAATSKLEMYRGQMIDTLTEMIPDGDDSIPMDLEFYNKTV